MDIKKIEIEGEEVFMKKDLLGWRVVEPIIHPETKKFSWKNFLNKKGFVTLALLLFFLFIFFIAFKEQVANYNIVMNDPCQFCLDCQKYAKDFASSFNYEKPINFYNISLIK